MNYSLLTDLYQLTMAYGYWKEAKHEDVAVFHLFFRKNPFNGGYAISCGLAQAIEFLKGFRFDVDDIQYLQGLEGNDGKKLFDQGFLAYLSQLRFSCTIHAMEEGELVFPHEPILRIQGPLLQCQLLETALLNLINFQTLIATKASRICRAAQGDPVLEFGLRRAQGVDGAIAASRAAFIGGCAATSNVLAGKHFGIPVRGTHAHSWVMVYGDELQAFQAYADAMPNNCVFLVDTYDTLEGVRNAVRVGKELRKAGHEMLGIRLDSGDLAALSIAARELLDQEGFATTAIVASNDLDEYRIRTLKLKGATISVWGVGTRLSTAYDQPALGGVYKLAAIQGSTGAWDYRIKLSEQALKISNPGILQVLRFAKNSRFFGDVILNEEGNQLIEQFISFEGGKVKVQDCTSKRLLVPIFEEGTCVYELPDIFASQTYAKDQLNQLAAKHAALKPEGVYPVGLEPGLASLKESLIQRAGGYIPHS